MLARSFETFSETLRSRGAEAGLVYLNQGVPHRYSAIYRVAEGKLRNVFLIDKMGEIRPEFLDVVPFEQSFCQFVLRDGVFSTDDSGTDKRLDGHPYQGVMVCYHGVPLLGAEGGLIGTVCHFDVTSHGLVDEEFELLQRAGRAFPDFLPKPADNA